MSSMRNAFDIYTQFVAKTGFMEMLRDQMRKIALDIAKAIVWQVVKEAEKKEAKRRMVKRCAWCGEQEGEGELITHTICNECQKILDKEITDYVAGRKIPKVSKLQNADL